MSSRPQHALVLFYNRRHNPLIIEWLRKRFGCRITCVAIDLGEIRDFTQLKEEAASSGATDTLYDDAREEYAEHFLSKAVKANAVYQDKYYLSAAIARPMLAQRLVKLANQFDADTVVHGFRGNDQVRLDMALSTLSNLHVVSALRDWDVTEDDVRRYAEDHGIPDEPGTNNPYSVSENIWGKSTECGPLEDAASEPPEEIYRYISLPESAPDAPAYLFLEFEKGYPVALNSKKRSFLDIILELNRIGADHGVGMTDMVEDGVVGIKTRAIYENPAATCLVEAHRDLERFVCNRHENDFKVSVDKHWAFMVYAGLWYDPLMDHLNVFNESMNELVSGKVKLRLFKGSVNVVSRESGSSIYDKSTAVYNFGHLFSQGDAEGFGRVHNLHTKMAFRKKGESQA